MTGHGTTVAGAAKVDDQWSFYKSKMQLRQTHKQLRAGLLVWEDVPKEIQDLLIRFYKYDSCGVQKW
jgi:hypothetical protein